MHEIGERDMGLIAGLREAPLICENFSHVQ